MRSDVIHRRKKRETRAEEEKTGKRVAKKKRKQPPANQRGNGLKEQRAVRWKEQTASSRRPERPLRRQTVQGTVELMNTPQRLHTVDRSGFRGFFFSFFAPSLPQVRASSVPLCPRDVTQQTGGRRPTEEGPVELEGPRRGWEL